MKLLCKEVQALCYETSFIYFLFSGSVSLKRDITLAHRNSNIMG